MPRTPGEVLRWLRARPSLDELRTAFPDEWERVQRHIDRVVSSGDAERLQAYLSSAVRNSGVTLGTDQGRPTQALISEAVRRQMTIEAIRQARLDQPAADDLEEPQAATVRLPGMGGWIMQRLLLDDRRRPKAASLRRFRMLWPWLPEQERLADRLMDQVVPQGIHCFYTEELIGELAELIGDRSCLELSTGDMTLSRLLADQGSDIRTVQLTDPEDTVEDVARALRRHKPHVVLCTWPASRNMFERRIFRTPSVEDYVVITAPGPATDDWLADVEPGSFEGREDERLSRMVLPPGRNAVHTFHRTRPETD